MAACGNAFCFLYLTHSGIILISTVKIIFETISEGEHMDSASANYHIRKLWPVDYPAFRRHLLRLDEETRHARFGTAVIGNSGVASGQARSSWLTRRSRPLLWCPATRRPAMMPPTEP